MMDVLHAIASIDFGIINHVDFTNINLGINLGQAHWNWFDIDWVSLAQAGKPQEFRQDVMVDIAKGWGNFYRSGQLWALLIGVVLGYLFRSVTAS